MSRHGMERAARGFLLAALFGAAGAAAAAEYVNGARVDGAEPGEWTHDWDAATAAAKKDGKPVFVNFTGSDWCGWCKLLKRQVFTQPEWGAWASNHVYLVHLDFPNDKALVPEKYRERNRDLSRRYKVGGYPTCFLLDPATLKSLGTFGASRDANAAAFIEKVSAAMPGEKSDAPARTESANLTVPRPTVTTTAPSAPWTFVPDEEGAALYWNGTISNGAVSLDARLAGGSAAVLFPEALSVPGGVLDLSTPIVDGSGAEVPLVGIGRDSDDSHVGFGGVRRMVSEIRLPATVQYLGPGAFERFLSLERFECPASVRCIGSAAFDGCRSLRTFRVGPAVESFSNDRVFMGCTALESIETDPANAQYKTVDGALFTADGKRLVAFPPGRKGPFAVPAGVEAIPPRAFLGCEGLTRVSIPASVKKIGEFAFAGCTALEKIEFEDTSFKLDDRVFGTSRPGETPRRPATNLAAE